MTAKEYDAVMLQDVNEAPQKDEALFVAAWKRAQSLACEESLSSDSPCAWVSSIP